MFKIASRPNTSCIGDACSIVWTENMVAARMPDPYSKKYYTVCVPDFGSEFISKMAIIVRANYGLKSSGAAFRNHLHDCMEHLGYESCKADLDVLMRSATRTDGQDYC